MARTKSSISLAEVLSGKSLPVVEPEEEKKEDDGESLSSEDHPCSKKMTIILNSGDQLFLQKGPR
jgi:hypothetical protein